MVRSGVGLGSQGGCEGRIEVLIKFKKKFRGVGVGEGRGVKVDVNDELKFFVK